MNKKIICFDLDNTLCKTEGNFYKNSKPIKNKILLVNKLYDKGYIIKIFTARFMGRSNENIKKATKLGYNFTKIQLRKWGVKYHKLIFGKPSYDLFIDDKNLNFEKNWDKKIVDILKIK
jgi:hydroxymethylpyrimidine pyrophosphatase-like HAD family hydrolase